MNPPSACSADSRPKSSSPGCEQLGVMSLSALGRWGEPSLNSGRAIYLESLPMAIETHTLPSVAASGTAKWRGSHPPRPLAAADQPDDEDTEEDEDDEF